MNDLVLSPQKLVLLAVHCAANADINSLAALASKHQSILRKDLVLRILLTYLPETVPSDEYVGLIADLASGDLPDQEYSNLDYNLSAIDGLSDEEATKKVRKLQLLTLRPPDTLASHSDDPVTLFLFLRAYRVDEEAGLLTQLPALLTPFLQHTPDLRIWMLSSLLPLLRRNYDYYMDNSLPYTLAAFQKLPDNVAVDALLSHTGTDGDYRLVGRDLRGLVGPWLHNDSRWVPATEADQSLRYVTGPQPTSEDLICPGWERMLEWLTAQASHDWRVAAAAVEQWNGPEDVDLGDLDSWLRETHQRYLDRRYARAILACAYLITETTLDALQGAHRIVAKAMDLLGEDDVPSLDMSAESLSLVPDLTHDYVSNPRNTAWMRDELLNEQNALTMPSQRTARLLHALILSAFLLTRAGLGCTIKRAGDLAFIQDEREQKAQALQLIHSLSSKVASRTDEDAWRRARQEILWLRDWGANPQSDEPGSGVFGQVKAEVLEAEILRALLANGQYSLAQDMYENRPEVLPKQILQDTVIAAALHAYDNASNPNRTRGGLRKCDEIMDAFPNTIPKTLPARQRIEALLKATHALSEYRLVLKQGEPFSPVVLRVHSDSLAIIAKVLEQNAKSYTRIQDFEEVGANMVRAGLTAQNRARGKHNLNPHALDPDEEANQLEIAKMRVTALCIEAALREDDFETAYSFVVGRLEKHSASPHRGSEGSTEDYSWRAALQAGQYIRNPHSMRPTHLGTASGNLEIRHLEQRIECLSTALRLAPPPLLQEILKTFRRCEEQLDSALSAEAALEVADEDTIHVPGGFGAPDTVSARQHHAVSETMTQSKRVQSDDSPMSLFDLSRATARAASRNFAALSSLQASAGPKSSVPPAPVTRPTPSTTDDGEGWGDWGDEGQGSTHSDEQHRVRKRDQLRDAAMGTLTSGVGWLIGAQPPSTQGHGERGQSLDGNDDKW